MKRSEIIRIIRDELGSREAVVAPKKHLDQLQAARILRAIEHEGMRPSCAYCENDETGHEFMEPCDDEWEPEDE